MIFRSIFVVFVSVSLLAQAGTAAAQQRTFINGSFESNDPQGPGAPKFQIFPDSVVIEWTDDTGRIELWDSGFRSVSSYDGDVHAELNANSPGTLFQDICLINGETLGWSFAHRAREGSMTTQTVLFEIADSSGTLIQSLASQSSDIGDGWNVNTNSATYTGATGVQRARFRTTDPGSVGNFLDNLQFDIPAFVQFFLSSSEDQEASGGNIPELQVYGRIDTPTDIPIIVTGGTADAADYTFTQTFVTLPIGLYSGESFPIPLNILDNDDCEPNETIELQLGTPSSGEVIFARRECDGAAPLITATYTINNDDERIEAEKTVEMYEPIVGQTYALPGEDVIYTITLTNLSEDSISAENIFLVDSVPDELLFYNGDIDDGGPELNPVQFTETASGLTVTYATDIGYSDAATPPTNIGECDFDPAAGYVDTVNFICFAPQGDFLAGDPDPTAAFSFRMRIK